MLKQVAVLGLAVGFLGGGSCSIDVNWPSTTDITLDNVQATIRIERALNDDQAVVTATLENAFGRTIELETGQAVEINGVALVGPDEDGVYSAAVDEASSYIVTVREPTRGVEDTVVAAPAAFAITAPAAGGGASLSGFTLEWSGAETGLQTELVLTQTISATKTEAFGPFPDDGSWTFDAEDLRGFFQGAPLSVTLTKVREETEVAGFKSATVTVAVWTTRALDPQP